MHLRLLPVLALCACATTPPAKPTEETTPDAGVVVAKLTAPDPQKLLAAAAKTQATIEADTGHAIRSVFFIGKGRLVVEETFSRGTRRIDFSGGTTEKPQRLATIVDKPDRWMVRTGNDKAEVTRPWEAVLPLSMLYQVLGRAQLRLVNEPLFVQSRFLHYDEGQAVYSVPLPPAERERLEQALVLYNRPPVSEDPQRKAQIQAIEQMLKTGQLVWVDPETGIISAVGTPEPQWVQGFAEVKKLPEGLFDVGVAGDPPPAPTAAELEDSVLISYNPIWKPNTRAGDSDLVLLNVTTGAVRRVPVRNTAAMPGGFLPGRTSVVVPAISGGSIRPLRVDLQTGSNHYLGGDTAAVGPTLFPVVSPDGKKVAVTMMSTSEGPLNNQLAVLDLATEQVVNVGPPMDLAFVSWLPKSDGFVLLKRESVDGEKEKKKVVGRLSMKGEFTPIVEGDQPLLLPGGKTVLFEGEGGLWRTCTLAGKQVKLFGDGLKDHASPTPAPDGKRLLMMAVGGDTPKPVLVDLKTQAVTDIAVPPGLFSFPSWR